MTTRRTLHLPALVAVALLLACAAALLVALAEKAEATFPSKNGKIAVVVAGVLYTINPNGGGKTKVTEGSGPSYSPDGKKIAYVASDGNDSEIYTINATGGKPFQITNNDTNDRHPSYSPDGKKIAYTCYFGDSQSDDNGEICTINTRGGKPFQVTHNDSLDFLPTRPTARR